MPRQKKETDAPLVAFLPTPAQQASVPREGGPGDKGAAAAGSGEIKKPVSSTLCVFLA